jgi:hypothetical protein
MDSFGKQVVSRVNKAAEATQEVSVIRALEERRERKIRSSCCSYTDTARCLDHIHGSIARPDTVSKLISCGFIVLFLSCTVQGH